MKKINLAILLILTVSSSIYGQTLYTSIPDANFEQKLINLGHDDVLDGAVLTATVEVITELNANNSGISDLTGIEAFTALTELAVYDNQLTSFDVSANTALTELRAWNNQLTSFDVSANPALTFLNVGGNQLTSFDVSANTALTELFVYSNQLTSFDVSANTALTILYVKENQLTSFDVSANTALTELQANDNPDLTCIYVGDNVIATTTLDENQFLSDIPCHEVIFFEKLNNADATNPANWDMVTPSVAITRGNNGALFNPLVESNADNSSPSGTMWSYGYTGEIAGYAEVANGVDSYMSFQFAYTNGAEAGFNSIVGKTLSMHCMLEDKFFDVTFESWTTGQGGGGFSYTRVEVDAPLNPVTVNVTFNVDMQFETVENGVWLAGGMAGNPGYEMIQVDFPGFETIYTVTLPLENGVPFTFKFVNGPIDENWGGAWEDVPEACGVGDFLDREILVEVDPDGNMFLPPVVFSQCTPNTEAEVTFHVDMQFETVENGVWLAGGMAGNPGFEMMDEDGDNIYSLTLILPTYDSFTYKFVNGPIDAGWQGGWEEVPAECGVGDFLDRRLLVANLAEYELPAVVFGSCDEATNEVNVTFHVDMQFETVENGVWLAGGNAGNPGFEMMDEEGDNVYSITLTLPINESYTYKFANGPINPDWSGPFEEVPAACGVGEYLDREVMVGVQSMNLPPVVFGSCTPEGVVLVTFNVDMQTENVDPDRGVWLAGGNAGNPGHEMMLLDMPGLQRIYTVTIPLESGTSFGYKFANGMINPDWSGNWEEVPAECGVGEYLDRQVIVGEMDMVLPPVGFGSCDVVPFPTAHITDVMDIPEDQGGRVYITFEKSRLDTDEPQRTEMYTIERLDGEQWVGLNSIGAYGSPIYTVEATTLGDSTSESMMMSTYRVVSNMDEGVFLSEPFSGHSVDNIAPMMLVGLDAGHSNGIVNLSWSPSEANDFSHYMIYYGSSPDFIPSPENLLGTSDSNPTFGHDVVEIGEHYYVVSAMDIHENESEYSEVASIALLSLVDVNGIPDNYTLHQNFPNPFNPTTQIKYELPSDALVNINIYDVMGRKIKSLTNSNQSAGYHSLTWDATNNIGEAVSAGMYIYTIQAGQYRATKKMVLLK